MSKLQLKVQVLTADGHIVAGAHMMVGCDSQTQQQLAASPIVLHELQMMTADVVSKLGEAGARVLLAAADKRCVQWPYGAPQYHQNACRLHQGSPNCDCAASDASDSDWGIGHHGTGIEFGDPSQMSVPEDGQHCSDRCTCGGGGEGSCGWCRCQQRLRR